ncbi:MAG: MvdD family ATP-grasp ribosomal peptide maturase, partial [Gammaproteobacteria bacterium]
MDLLGLNFGCIDMILTPDDEFVFLEVNPNGQWLWVEHSLGCNISGAIADKLIGCSSGSY